MQSQIKLIITIIIVMGTTTYLNQEVPACIDNPTNQTTVQTNYSTATVNNLSTKLESNMIVFQTSGTSMLPLIKPDQKCVCLKSVTYSVGDIVIFFANFGNGFTGIAHEIISEQNGTFITKGVNNIEADSPIKKENILCEIPKLKRWQLLNNEKT